MMQTIRPTNQRAQCNTLRKNRITCRESTTTVNTNSSTINFLHFRTIYVDIILSHIYASELFLSTVLGEIRSWMVSEK